MGVSSINNVDLVVLEKKRKQNRQKRERKRERLEVEDL